MFWEKDYRTDGMYRSMKSIASSGRGEYGPHYDAGVLYVIHQLEAFGTFMPNPVFGWIMAMTDPMLPADPDEAQDNDAARCFLREHGLTEQQGREYARGARQAERELALYRDPSCKDLEQGG